MKTMPLDRMSHGRLVLPLCCLLFSLVVYTAPAISGERDPLWVKALAITAPNLARRPARMVEDEKIYSEDDELKRHTVSTFTFKWKGRKPETRLVKAVRGGKDITEQRREELKSVDKRRGLTKDENNIFHPAWYEHNEVRRTSVREVIDGHKCVAFEYTVKADNNAWDGVVFLDEKSGAPRKILSAAERIPNQEKVDAWDVNLEFHYEYKPPRDWKLVRMEIRAQFRTKIVLFKFTGRIHTVMKFSGHGPVTSD